ncbi:hypothetical protein MNBD_GAMMA18-498 [hydrothermal vent metagenome]|uniref:Uncharacterized protein n=1 Tax=hydrothermal vent metagenome TaxID=652676 RepID=A0A3B0ZLA4_9ZZZZ
MCAEKSDAIQQMTTDKRYVEEQLSWLDNIDSLKTDQAKTNLIKSLRYLNKAVLATSYRYQLMIKLYKQAQILIDNSERDAKKKARNTVSVKLTRHLLQESIASYEIIISEFIESGDPQQQQELLAQSFCHTLRLESRYLMEHYLSYEPISNDVWNKIKRLYHRAQQLKLINMPLYEKTGAVQTIEEAFVAVLLFAAINPFRLHRSEIVNSYHILSQWAHHCHFEPCDSEWRSNGEWVICLNSGRPPEYLPAEQQPEDTDGLLRINIDTILEKDVLLGQKSAEENSDTEHTQLKQTLLERLRNGWITTPPRSYERRSHFQKMTLSVGLKNCHQLLIEEEVQLSSNHSPTWTLHLANQWLEAEVDSQERIIDKIQQIDVGIGGYGLSCPLQHYEKFLKGSLLLIRNANDSEKPWSIAQTCWKQIYEADSETIVGVSLLAVDAAPLIIIHAETKTETNGGLLLPRGDFNNPLATLILPDGHQEGETIQCITAHAQVKIELIKSLKQGPDFQQFSYRVVG